MRHDFHGRFRYLENSLYILVPEMTGDYIARKMLGGDAKRPMLHGEPVKVEVEL